MRAAIRSILFSTKSVIPFILDTLPVSSAAAYSLRLLRTAYSGFCIRVRRSSDNTEQNIGFVSGVLDTTALLAFVGGGSGFVVTRYDQSGNSRDQAQSVAANQPRIVSNGVIDLANSKPTIFALGNSALTTALFTCGVSSFSVTTVASSGTTDAPQRITSIRGVGDTNDFILNTSAIPFYVSSASAIFAYRNNSASSSISPITVTALNVLTIINNNSNNITFGNGTQGTTVASYGALGDSIQLSTFADINAAYAFNASTSSELIMFYSALSTADRQLLEANQKAYYGTP